MAERPERQERVVQIVNRLGLHARAAARFVEVASRFDAQIAVMQADREANGKSIMGLMMLAAGYQTRITIRAQGHDAREALNAISELVADRFGEAD